MAEIINHDWSSDPRCHFGILNAQNDPMLTQREDIKPAINFIVYSAINVQYL